GGAAGEGHGRLAAREVDHSHILPEHALRQTRSERLGACFLGRETLGVGGCAVAPAVRLCAFDLGKAAAGEALAEPFQRLLYATNVDEVATHAYYHCPPFREVPGSCGCVIAMN